MAKALNVNVAVTADTSAARAQLQQLQTMLTSLSSAHTLNINGNISTLTAEIQAAQSAASQLAINLHSATNINTGKLDLMKFNSSLQASGMTLSQYKNQLMALGPTGEQAFAKLTTAIAQAEVPATRLSKTFSEFGTVVKNTIKWQAASTIIHGMIGSIQHAFNYAQQLNESLNRIQIVTQASSDHMAKFAEQANKAAQRLSTTTTAYTNASLIYYQQGLSDKEVAARTEVTIKMANASGQSAEKVSNQMTAIWNNFAQGSSNLEYYADVITALGAATASSSEEIATGLQKFASVADTVGLSYENATAALATITATTRQSADSVGTGLRTLFARLQSLNLGETLDDGVTLTKYTKALEKIGVSVLEANGNMRSMDDILADMGAKWKTLTDAQKTATAQTVGGVRQYTTLMALMENFDKYQQNLLTAKNSKGTVQAQADIYAKSWEASTKRVKAAAEGVYSSLIDDKFFINFNDFLAKLISGINSAIKGLGGFKGVLSTVLAIAASRNGDKLANLFSNMAYNMSYRKNMETAANLKKEAVALSSTYSGDDSVLGKTVALNYSQQVQQQNTLIQNAQNLTQADRERLELIIQENSAIAEQNVQVAKNYETNKTKNTELIKTLNQTMAKAGVKFTDITSAQRQLQTYASDVESTTALQQTASYYAKSIMGAQGGPQLHISSEGATYLSGQIDYLANMTTVAQQAKDALDRIRTTLTQSTEGGFLDLADADAKQLAADLEKVAIAAGEVKATSQAGATGQAQQFLNKTGQDLTNKVLQGAEELGQQQSNVTIANVAANTKGQTENSQVIPSMIKGSEQANKTASAFSTATTAIMAFNSALSIGASYWDTWESHAQGATKTGEAVISTLSGIASQLTTVMMAFSISGPAGWIATAVTVLTTAGMMLYKWYDSTHESKSEQIERLNNEAQEATEYANAAKQAYDDLLSGQSAHNDLLDTLKQLTAGTNEFYNALIQANSQARELIANYKLSYGQDWKYNDQGAIEFTDTGNKNMEAQAKAKMAFGQYNESLATFLYQNTAHTSLSSEDILQVANQLIENGGEFGHYVKQVNNSQYALEQEQWRQTRGWDFKLENLNTDQTSDLLQQAATYLTEHPELLEEGQADKALSTLENTFGPAISEIQNSLLETTSKGLIETLTPSIQQERTSNYLNIESMLRAYAGAQDNGETSELQLQAAMEDFKKSKETQNEDIATFYEQTLKNLEDENNLNNLAQRFFEATGYQADSELLANPETMKMYIAKAETANKYGKQFMALVDKDVAQWSDYQTVSIKELQQYATQARAAGKTSAAEILEKEYNRIKTEVPENLDKLYSDLSENLVNEIKDQELTPEEAIEKTEALAQAYQAASENLAKIIETGKASAQDIELAMATINQSGKFGSKFQTDVLGNIFKDGKINTDLQNILSSLDFSNKLSSLFNLKGSFNIAAGDLKSTLGTLYDDLFEEIGGQSGIFSQIFGEEDFQKELKKVQKEFKKTGKISTKNIDSIADSCDDLSEALDLNLLSAGAVADALELYSMGAIDSIDSISEKLWEALGTANTFADTLREAFNYIDSWNPDRSVGDIGKHYGDVAKDYFSELSNGTTGSERLYQDAAELWGQSYSQNLRDWFYNEEYKYADDPEKRAKDYKKAYGKFDEVMQQVQKDGNMAAYWEFLTNSDNADAISKVMGVDDMAGALKGIGITSGKNGKDIEVDTQGRTTDEFISDIENTLGVSHEQATALVHELAGHGSTIATDLKTQDFMAGLSGLEAGTADYDQYLLSQEGSSLSTKTMKESVAREQEEAEKKLQKYKDKHKGEEDSEKYQKRVAELQAEIDKYQEQADALEKVETRQKQLKEDRKYLEEHKDVDIKTPEDAKEFFEGLSEGTQEYLKNVKDANTATQTLEDGTEATVTDVLAMADAGEALGMSGEQIEATTTALQQEGEVLGTTITDSLGNTHTILMEEGESLDDFKTRVQETADGIEKDIEQTTKDMEQQELGKNIFKGFMEGLKELQENAESEPIELPITLKLPEDFDISSLIPEEGLQVDVTATDINGDLANLETALTNLQNNKDVPITITTTNSPSSGSGSINGVASDLATVDSYKTISVSISLSNKEDLESFAQAGEDLGAVADAAEKLGVPVTVDITVPEDLDSSGVDNLASGLEKVKNNSNTEVTLTIPAQITNSQVITDLSSKLEGMRNVTVEVVPPTEINSETIDEFGKKLEAFKSVPISVHLEPGTTVADMQALLDKLPNKKNVTVSLTMPDGTTFDLGNQGFWQGLTNKNDQTSAKGQLDVATTRYSDYAEIGQYHIGPEAGEDYWQAYNADYNGTGYSVGSVANGAPMRVITPEMLSQAGLSSLSEVYQSDGKGNISLTEAGQKLLEAAEKQELAAQAEEEAAESQQPAENSGTVVSREGSNGKVSVNGKDYSLDGTKYNEGYFQNLAQQLQSAQGKANDESLSSEERNIAQQQAEQISQSISQALAEVMEKNPTETETGGETEGGTSGKTELTVGDTSVTLEAEANITNATYDGPPLDNVPAKLIYEGQDETGKTIQVEVDPDDSALQAELESKGFKQVTLDPDSNEVDSYIDQPGAKIVNLYVGTNEPAAAIAGLPTSHSLSITCTVSVTASNAFGSSVSFAGGGEILSSAVGNFVNEAAEDYALNAPPMLKFLDETRRHYMKGEENCQYSQGTCRDGGSTGGKATGASIYHSYVNGSANRYSKPGISLTAEEGPEIVWNKQEGYAYLVGGEGHPEFAELRPGDRIFNANDTRQILNYHRPKSNAYSAVKDPRELGDALFGSHASGSAYGSYGPDTKYGTTRGGGAGTRSSNKRTKDYTPERYHLITRQIQDLTFWYQELQKARENAYGVNVLDAIDKEIKATDELVRANRALLKEAEDYLAKDKKRLKDLGIQAEFDEAGNLLNYEKLQEQYRKVMETSEDQDKKDKATEAWKAIEQYEETLDKVQEAKAELSDALYDYAELRLEKIQVKAEMKIDFDDKEIAYIQHFLDKIDDKIYATADALNLVSSQMSLINNKLDTTHNAINEVFEGMVDRYGNPISMTYEKWLSLNAAQREALDINGKYGKQLEEYAENIKSYIEELEKFKTKGVEELSAAFDELNTKVTTQIGLYDHYANMLSSLRDLADLQGIKIPKEMRDSIAKLNAGMSQVTNDRITSQKEYYEELSREADALREKLASTTDTDLVNKYQAELDKIEQLMREASENIVQLWQDGLNKAKDIFDQALEWAKEDYEASLSEMYGTSGLLQEAFDRKNDLAGEYVDDYEKYYQLGKLQRQINKDIDTAAVNGNKANKNLKALLEEIQKLQASGAELSAYDLDILEKKYEYEKALADLEDARNAKQTVRLQRDRNGNWGYVYTAADDADLAEYEQAVEDKLYEYTKAATEQSKSLQNEILSLWAEAGEKVAQMRADGVSDEVIDDYIADTQQKLNFLMSQLEKTGADVELALPKWMKITNDTFNLTTDTFEETILSVVSGMETIEQTGETITDAIMTIANATKEAADDYNASIEALNSLVSGNEDGYMANANAWAAAITQASAENIENTHKAVVEMGSMYDEILTKATEFEDQFMQVYEPIIRRNEEFLAQLLNALGQLNGLGNNLGILLQANTTGNNTNYQSFDTGGYTGSWGPDGKLAFLHQKEQIFNAKDTENLLTAANILKTLDLQTGSFERGLGDFFSPSVKDLNQTIEQQVTITAEFPNATNHSEIEEAFNNLANRATQYANRKVG